MNEIALREPTRHKLTVDDFSRMAEAGIFGRDERIELIDGGLVDMAPIGDDRAGAVVELSHLLFAAVGDRAAVSVQNPLRLDTLSEPQPDFVVFRRRFGNFRDGGRPGAADALLVIEVADSSLRYDREVKLPLYARAGIPEVWLLDLQQRVLEAHRDPAGDAYSTVLHFHNDDEISLVAAPRITVRLTRVFA